MIYFSDFTASAPAGAYGSHQYWRLYMTDNYGATLIAFEELEFLDSTGASIARSGGTASASTSLGGRSASNAFDGSTATGWSSDSVNTNQWISYQFPSAVAAEKVRITLNTGGYTTTPKNCKLQYSDNGSTWTDAFSFVFAWPLPGQVRTFPEVLATGYHRGFRIYCVDNNGGGTFIGIQNIEMRATAGGADQTVDNGAAGRTTIGGSFESSFLGPGNEGYKAFDNVTTGTTGTWGSNGTTNQWVGYIFTSPVKVEEISLIVGYANQAPKNMRLEYSDDESTWTTQKTFAAQTGWTVNVARVLSAL